MQPQWKNASRPIEAFVFGHTHLPNNQRGQPGTIEKLSPGEVFVLFGFNPVRMSVTPVAINGGRVAADSDTQCTRRLRNDHGLSEQALLRSVKPRAARAVLQLRRDCAVSGPADGENAVLAPVGGSRVGDRHGMRTAADAAGTLRACGGTAARAA